MSRRFLITCWPFVGHVLPQMSIATALRERGAEVAFYTGRTARELIDREAIPIFEFERVDEGAVTGVVRGLETSAKGGRPRPGAVRRSFRRWLVDTIPDQVADLRAVIERWQPDVLVTDLSMWGPIVILSETTRIPVALSSTFMGPLTPSRDAPPPGLGLPSPRGPATRAAAWAARRATDRLGAGLRQRVDELRAAHGLGPMGCSVNEFTGRLPLYLVGNIPELDYGRRDVPPSVHYVGPCLWHPPDAPGSAAWLEDVPAAHPWVHVSEGTLHAGDPFVLRATVRGLAGRPVEVIGTTGGRSESGDLGPGALPSNVHLTPWVSHAELLPRCSVLVTTGGPNTIITALSVGVPLVVVPTTWDKPDNAQRVVEAGVGVRLAPRRCTPERVRAAVGQVLEDPAYGAAAASIAERLAAAPGPARAAELLEALAPVESAPTRARATAGDRP
jgi:MGT family glycosyltransferase